MAELTARARQDEPVGQGRRESREGRRGHCGSTHYSNDRLLPTLPTHYKLYEDGLRKRPHLQRSAAAAVLCCGMHETVRKTVKPDG